MPEKVLTISLRAHLTHPQSVNMEEPKQTRRLPLPEREKSMNAMSRRTPCFKELLSVLWFTNWVARAEMFLYRSLSEPRGQPSSNKEMAHSTKSHKKHNHYCRLAMIYKPLFMARQKFV